MYNLLFILTIVNLFPIITYTQWTWITGSQSGDTFTNYGEPYPGGLASHTTALDHLNRYLYIFGGQAVQPNSPSVKFESVNDLWRFDTDNVVWEYLEGNNSLVVSNDYGGQYIGCIFGQAMVIDSTDQFLYVFGGTGYVDGSEGSLMYCIDCLGVLNDMWKYDLGNHVWEYVSGSQRIGTPANYTFPYPGGMVYHTMVIDGADRFLYVFGGSGLDNETSGLLNDLWKYDLVNHVWEYLSGSQRVNALSDYIYPYPGGVQTHSMVIGNEDRYLYVFGGNGFDNEDDGRLNDLWRYKLTGNTWKHLSGNKTRDSLSNYTLPGGIRYHKAVMYNTSMYVFGGLGFNNASSGNLNDLWVYDVVSNAWEHLYGNQAIDERSNYYSPYPGGVQEHTLSITSNCSTLLMFGGIGFDDQSKSHLNDMWKYSIVDMVSSEYSSDVQSVVSSASESISEFNTLDEYSQQNTSMASESSSAVVIGNGNNNSTIVIDGDVIFSDDNVIVIDSSDISSTGTVSIYTDIVLQGDSTITTSKCISAFNNSQIIIDLTTRTKEQKQVLSYNCLTVPDLDIELRGSYPDGCIPRYEVQQTSLILIFDTQSCKASEKQDILPVLLIIGSIILVCIILGSILIIMLTNKNIRQKIFNNRTNDNMNEVSMTNINDKMKLVDDQISATTAQVDRLNTILDE